MGNTSIGAPGTPNGPCLANCRHTECEELREIAGTPCGVCRQQIGYLRPFTEDQGGLAHAGCVSDRDDRNAAALLVGVACARCGRPLGQGRPLTRNGQGELIHKKC